MCRKLIFLISFVLPLSLVANTAVADFNLAGRWTFDEGEDIYAPDCSGHENHGTIGGDPQWVDGIIGQALAFDGNDYVDLGNPSILDFGTGDFTICAWIKTTNGGDVFAKGWDGRGGIRYEFYTDTTIMKLEVDDSADKVSKVRAYSTTTINDGEWHHVVGMRDGTTMRIYVDGNPDGTETLPGGYNLSGTSQGNAYIGVIYCNRDKAFKDHFIGLIDDVRVYNYALSKDDVAAIYASWDSDAQIAKDPDKALQKAREKLQDFGNWRTTPTVRTEHAGEIAGTLLVIAKAKEAQNLPSEEVLKDYYELIEQFPNSAGTIRALCKVVSLDKENGLAYATNFLEKSGTPGNIIAWYARLIKSYLAEADYLNVEKYVKLFINKYGSRKDGPYFMVQLMGSIGRVEEREQLDEIIESKVVENPNSEICCAVFRQRAQSLSDAKDSTKVLEMAESVRREFPETKLATCATAVLADNEYRQDNFVLALEAFRPQLFAEHRPEAAIIEDIDRTLALYNASTLRIQGIDLGKVCEALAKYTHGSGRDTVAVHCYRQSAKAKGFYIEAFERAASGTTKYCNTGPENEIWFWKGLFAAEEGDLMAAAMISERFLKADSGSILAAAAYYNTARAKMALGWYAESKEAIAKAKSISPCQPVIELEQELARTETIKFQDKGEHDAI